jgi:hypothetical protein
MLFALMHEYDNSKNMLYQKGKMTAPNKSVTMPKSKEAWHYLKNSLPPSLFTSSKRSKIKRELSHTNLSLSSQLYSTSIQTLTASSCDEYAACRDVLSSLFGVGVRKRFPNKSDVLNNQKNPTPLATYDTINVVDIALSDDESLELDGDVDRDRFMKHRNFMRWRWNPVSRMCTTTIRCTPLVVSCNSDTIISFLSRFKIDMRSSFIDDDQWHVGAFIFGDEKQFQIVSFDRQNNNATLSDVGASDATTRVVSYKDLKRNFSLM